MNMEIDPVQDATLVKKGWNVLLGDLEALGAAISKLSADSLAAGQERLAEDLAHLQDSATEVLTRAKAQTSAVGSTIENSIRANPVGAAMAAFGAGALLAVLLTRRA